MTSLRIICILKLIEMDTGKNPATRKESSSRLIIVGYTVLWVSIFILPIVFIPLGIGIGIINVVKGETGHGIAQIVLAIVLVIIDLLVQVLV